MANIQKRYTDLEIEEALTTLAVLGDAGQASKAVGIPKATLNRWRKSDHATRYDEIRARVLPKIQAQIAKEAEELVALQAEAERLLTERLIAAMPKMDAKDLANALRNVATSKAINVDKSLVLHGQPNVIVEKRDGQEIVRSIAERFPQLVRTDYVEATAEEIEPDAR